MTPNTAPSVTLFVASRCPHCPAVLHALSELIKKGTLRELRVFNIEQAADEAASHKVRSVPWIRIGDMVLTGLYSQTELEDWIHKAASPQGHAEYLAELLSRGELAEAGAFLREDPTRLTAVLTVLGDPERELSIRIGAGALVEDLAGTEHMAALQPGLIEMLHHEDSRIRGDAAHYLAMSGDAAVVPELRRLLDDPDEEVREIASDGLEMLGPPS